MFVIWLMESRGPWALRTIGVVISTILAIVSMVGIIFGSLWLLGAYFPESLTVISKVDPEFYKDQEPGLLREMVIILTVVLRGDVVVLSYLTPLCAIGLPALWLYETMERLFREYEEQREKIAITELLLKV